MPSWIILLDDALDDRLRLALQPVCRVFGLAVAAVRLPRAQRLESVGKLAGGIAHEVDNMMYVVLGCSEFVLRRPDLHPAVRADVEQVRQAAERSAAITAQLLAFGRRQMLQPVPLDLNAVVREPMEHPPQISA